MTPRMCTPEEAAGLISTTDAVGFGLGPANPDAFLTALGGRNDWEHLTFGGALLLNYYPVFTHPNVNYRCGFFGPAERLLDATGANIELVPGGFRQFAPILRRYNPRVMTVLAAPPENGMINLSLHLGATYDELVLAGQDPDRLLVVEVNANLPRTHSLPPDFTNTIPLDIVDVLIETDATPFTLPAGPIDEVDMAIAELAQSFITDGVTLQIGIGAVPNIVATKLAEGRGGGYGIHSEMFTDGIMLLHQAGKITNDAKHLFNGVSITTFALGSAELYAWLDGNEDVAFVPVQVVNDPSVISRNHAFVSINGALCVDLYGQVVADNIGGRQISGVGGHEDFVAGAGMELDDQSLICLHSTAVVEGEVRSRIVPVLPEGSIVSTPRHHTGVIITEYGSADLSGCTVRERANALAEIAHPDFRAELRARAAAL
ncbi:MAG: acetyl-CoA hydrolase/transferase C-terminal domain-containing protein [Acidimicrobiales bacterium]